MNGVQKLFCRCYQTAFRIVLPVLPYRNPEVLYSIGDIPGILYKEKVERPMIITDRMLSALGAADALRKTLEEKKISFVFFDKAFPNPTTTLAYEGAEFYKKEHCDGIIAFGGGSPMDLAKAVGICVVKKGKRLEKMAGVLKVNKKLPLLIAVPTTAGTGSETTLAAVLVEEKTRHKFAINDFPLIPPYAVLDPETVHTLPRNIAAETGIDALTHAVEAYIGRSTTPQTRKDAKRAVSLIFRYLDAAVNHESREAEGAMLEASHYAGRSFTRSYVGYVHAVSHSLSGRYDLPHGRTNAILLPIVLRLYGSSVHKKLAELALCAGLGKEDEEDATLAEKFISEIEAMNKRYNIPSEVDVLREEDILQLADYADKEANPLYPVPVLWDKKELQKIYKAILPKA